MIKGVTVVLLAFGDDGIAATMSDSEIRSSAGIEPLSVTVTVAGSNVVVPAMVSPASGVTGTTNFRVP